MPGAAKEDPGQQPRRHRIGASLLIAPVLMAGIAAAVWGFVGSATAERVGSAGPDTGGEIAWEGVPATLADVDGNLYTLEQIEDHGSSVSIVPTPYPPTLDFFVLPEGDFRGRRKALAVYDGCNGHNGPYAIGADGALVVDEQFSTMIGCVGPLNAQARLLQSAVATGAAVTIDGDRLRVSKEGVNLTLRHTRRPTPEEAAAREETEREAAHAECLGLYGLPPSTPVATFRVTLPDGTEAGPDNEWDLVASDGAVDLEVDVTVADGAGVERLTYLIDATGPGGTTTRTLAEMTKVTKGPTGARLHWDLRDETGQLVAPGTYHLSAVAYVEVDSRHTCDQFTPYTEGHGLGFVSVPSP